MIQSFVFFDLETTGLIRGTNMPRITEIALIAVSRKSLCESKEMPPRVTHKLVIPINPIIRIPPEVSVLTGIFNDNLDNVAPFKNNTYELMIQFIQTLSPPVCMVAHNGNQFDYPILLHELQSIGKEIPEGVLAIDSLNAFKHYFNKSSSEPNVSSKCTDNSSAFLEAPNSEDFKFLLNDGLDEMLSFVLDQTVAIVENVDPCESNAIKSSTSEIIPVKEMESVSLKINGTEIPQKKANELSIQEINERTPVQQIVKADGIKVPRKVMGRVNVARKRLHFPATSNRPANFKLSTIYEHFIGSTSKRQHTAEGDCLSMLKCIGKFASTFAHWADMNAVPLAIYSKKN